MPAAISEEELKKMKQMPEIDMSKVANMDALDADTRKAVGAAAQRESSRRSTKRKFNFVHAVEIEIPSRGKFYQDSPDEDLRNGIIKLYPMSMADEEILTNESFIRNGSYMRLILDSCMASDYDARKILDFDGLYILYALRKITYGDDYHFRVTCDECGHKFDYDMNISDIEWVELPDDAVDERSILFPVSGYSAVMRLPRLDTVERIDRIKKQYKCTERTAAYIARTVTVLDDTGAPVIPSDWADFFEALPVQDRKAINDSFEGMYQFPKMDLECPSCGNPIEMSVPIDSGFFRIE